MKSGQLTLSHPYPTWLKKIQLAFCNPYGGAKTLSKETFPYVTYSTRISCKTGVPLGEKGCFFSFITNFLNEVKHWLICSYDFYYFQ